MATRSILLSTFNHVAFPPDLPGKADNQSEEVEKALLRRMLDAVQSLKKSTSHTDILPTWQMIENTLETTRIANEGETCNKSALLKLLKRVSPENSIILRIKEQNAGLLIHKAHNGGNVIVEAFEISPSAEQTIAAEGALQWDFPNTVVVVPPNVFDEAGFQESFALFLEKASIEPLDEFVAKVRKAGKEISEDRNTVDPAIITQFLMTLLETNGQRVYLPVLRKRIKDDVCWENARLPWRRSPLWLALRVCVQRLLYQYLGSEAGRIHYKALMCLVLARLLDSCITGLSSEHSHFLKVKLCRRLAKLVTESETLSPTTRATCLHVRETIESFCKKSIDAATEAIEKEWNIWKSDFRRRIPTLPMRAPQSDFRLTLPNSTSYFKDVLNLPQRSLSRAEAMDPMSLGDISTKNTTKQFAALTKTYSSLAAREVVIESKIFTNPSTKEAGETQCVDLAWRIEDYMSAVGDAYDNDPEQMSIFILSIFEMWVHLDKCATTVYPLLNDYHPWFSPEILDVLLLSRLDDLRRLQNIQSHLHSRCTQARQEKMTIFADPSPGCFAERFFDSPQATTLRQLRKWIDDASWESRDEKRQELEEINESFRDLTEKLRLTTCTQLRNPDGTHNIKGCSHCYYMRCRRRLEIKVHEDFLPIGPHNIVQQRSIVFELNTPKSFSAYREATWNIVNRLCPKIGPSARGKPELLLAEYSQLRRYNYNRKDACFSLASHTKSFLGTHYDWKRLPAGFADVLLPHGPKYSYYDSKRKLWADDFPIQLNLVHHFSLSVPQELPFSALYSSSSFAVDSSGPSSYEVIASVNECPSELSVHEFTAHQSLIGGRNRRWLSILSELGSANINFSLQETMVLFHHLALQAGPGLEDEDLRVVHVVFRDPRFCSRLAEQISRHVEAIATNWRETNYMETLLTLAIQLCSLGHPDSRADSTDLLLKIRRITSNWITLLRNETRNAEDADLSDRAARYCFLSALLCRRTFSPWISNRVGFDANHLKCFFEASLAMQESLVVDLSKFTRITRNMLIRDIKMSARLPFLLRSSLAKYPNSLGLAIDTVWPEADHCSRPFGEWKLLAPPYEDWVTSTTHATDYTLPQAFYFHLLEGHLVINGRTIGKLPADIRDSDILKELFGNQRLFAFPSNLPGMDYALANRAEGHYIHLGYRNQQLVIQARAFNSTLELVPRHVFGKGPVFDLPLSLISDCIHWVDLRTGILEARQKPHIWRRRKGNWTVDLHARKAQRGKGTLVDPFSGTAQSISQIFLHFEHPCRLTIFQPPIGKLSVELKRMDLDFFVNRGGLLECRQLGSVIDRNQDAGTLYGLQSMIVLRSANDRSQRSIITPLGKPTYRRHKSHVLVTVDTKGSYARYAIDDLLGRLRCPAEPRLLYAKAQLHALTSHFLPDPLTGRTGTEEALVCLQSGYCQPWVPFTPELLEILMSISSLTPRREYYPKDKQCQQIVYWDSELTANIQHDAFEVVVNTIINKSQRLSLFSGGDVHLTWKKPANVTHLRERARWRRSLYERPSTLSQQIVVQSEDLLYPSRDIWSTSKRTSNVREVVTLLRSQPSSIRTTRNLTEVLETWPSIGGYASKFSLYDLGECMTADLADEWGGLVNLCREAKKEDVYHLMFQLGVIAFREDANMEAIRVIVSFFLLAGLKTLVLPPYTSFAGFKANEKPTTDTLIPIIRISYQPAKPTNISRKGKRDLRNESSKFGYDANYEREAAELARLLVRQWPCAAPSIEGFDPEHLDVWKAMGAVLPEWQRMYQNEQLHRHITEVQTILDRHYKAVNDIAVPPTPSKCLHRETTWPGRRSHFSCPRLEDDLLGKSALEFTKYAEIRKDKASHSEGERQPGSGPPVSDVQTISSPEIAELEVIAYKLAESDCSVRSRYAQDLVRSITALKEMKRGPGLRSGDQKVSEGVAKSNEEVTTARALVNNYQRIIIESLSAGDSKLMWLQKGNLWPALTPLTMLQQLRSTSRHQFGPGMEELFISYGLAVARLQKFLRLREAFARGDEDRLNHELNDPGHTNWDPAVYPDWLLLEIVANIQIRQEQITVALEMISPVSGSNSVLQMNMGQGKTSVIMPMVAAVLADGEMLNRLLVPKALLSQAAQILQSRLGGLLGREIIHIPFSRRTRTTPSLIRENRQLHENALLTSGIILGIPEHILSFKLSGLQRLADSKLNEAVEMIETQNWMNEVCRDLLDECDFTLAVKTQLIYPGGAQLAVDGHPDRWEVAMTLLGLVAHHLRDLARDYPQSIDVLERSQNGFPVAYLLRKDVEEALISKIVDDICSGRASILPLRECTERAKEAIRVFISQEKVDKAVTKRIARLFPDSPKARKKVYLLRGLLVHGILILCLKKRWNVQYGLHPRRDPIAVPVHAKGVSSDQAEWGHPDVAILFTCLAFYYEGLSQAQLKRSLEAVLKSDHPATEYDRWTHTSATLFDALRHWNVITVDDQGQVAEIWRHLRFTTTVINHFLGNFVFPLHAKQFTTKLQASGWDVLLYSNAPNHTATEIIMRPGITTGFSGTNDNRRLLPLTIEQCDLPGLTHTNAEVLTYLLQSRNRGYLVAADKNRRRLSEVDLLKRLKESKIRILIDAGAFIMEMDNLTVAKTWLQEDSYSH